MVCPAVSPAEFRAFIVQAFVGPFAGDGEPAGGVGLLEEEPGRTNGLFDAPPAAGSPAELGPSGARCWPYDGLWSLRDECFAELLAEEVFDDEDEDFDDEFDEDFEEDWEDDLPQDEEFPDTFGGDDEEEEKKSPFKDDPDFDD
ncbi:MAG: hypothetical protein AAGA92_13200 [Planctomycetota bacterium]